MNVNQLYREIGYIDDKLIEEAAKLGGQKVIISLSGIK